MQASHGLMMVAAGGVLTLALAGVGGCSGTTYTGTPYTLRLDRKVQAYVPSAIMTTHAIARNVVEDEFLFTVEHDAVDARQGIIEARNAKGSLVKVETYYASDTSTRVQVYVGPAGDEQAAVDLLSHIETRVSGQPFLEPAP